MQDRLGTHAPHLTEPHHSDGTGIFRAALIMLAAYAAIGVAIWYFA